MFLLCRVEPSTAPRITRRIMRIERRHPPRWMHTVRAIALDQLGRPQQAMAMWQALHDELIPSSSEATNILATIHRLQGERR